MNISDIRQGNETIIELRGRQGLKNELREGMPVQFIENEHTVLVSQIGGSGVVEVEPIDEKNSALLRRLLTRNLPNLSFLLTVEKNGQMVVSTRTFADELPMDITIGIEDDFVKKAKTQMKFNDLRNPEGDLSGRFLLEMGGQKYAVMGVHTEAYKRDRLNHFILSGEEGYLQIRRQEDEEGGLFFYAERIHARIDESKYVFTLVKGKIAFNNATFLEKARLATIAAMNELNGSIEGYLNTWEKYGLIEQQITLNKAKRAGAIRYSDWEYVEGGLLRLHVAAINGLGSFAREVPKGMAVIMSEGEPSFALDEDDFKLSDYKAFLKNEENLAHATVAKDIQVQEERIFISRVIDDMPPPKKGYVFLSLNGDMERFRRRAEARDRILNGTNMMPQLAAILEGKSVSIPRPQRYEAISSSVKNDIFPTNDPTPTQKEAIELAINTPDIAIIQGPPGTGKTTVIRAILKRLNEIGDASDGLFGQNLVSAYQHDAVQNAVERIEILGMPAIKLGNRSSSIEEKSQVIELMVENWINDRLRQLYDRYPEIIKNDHMAKFDDLYNNYMYSSNTVESTLRLLEDVRGLLFEKLNTALIEELNRLTSELRMTATDPRDPAREFLIRSIRSIPITSKAYGDNGKETMMGAVMRLKRERLPQLDPEISVLEVMSRKPQLTELDFNELRVVRKRLLAGLIPVENIFHTKKQKSEVMELLGRISDLLRKQFQASALGEDAVLMEYITEHANSPLAIRNSILEYVSVLGVTNQQVMGRKVSRMKGENGFYENVLVDEAARSNPLDLFIPMSLARDRIILVGDHRQLPHIVDEEIVSELERNYGSDKEAANMNKVKDNINDSLFQHLFRELKKLEKKDGIKRTVTLDKQYRTHPVLGDFISKHFYQKHGEVYIDSPLPATKFEHRLPGLENKACVWLDVPLHSGAEVGGQSKSRPVEAARIALHLKELMDSDEAYGLNFGIIAFYREQVKKIYDELVKIGLAIKLDGGEEDQYEIVGKYKEEVVNGKKIEKLRIGTVDAFQGMEFDVVYLSMVRSNPMPNRTPKEKQRKYGHLMVENRLCVSMSRQKRMLIVAGDSGMLRGAEAEKAIPALVNYYSLCQGEKNYGKILI